MTDPDLDQTEATTDGPGDDPLARIEFVLAIALVLGLTLLAVIFLRDHINSTFVRTMVPPPLY